ncbi:MAG: (R)-citramalate synthase [Archaeoglobi archaeon]|nr:(R)-citramalate synthase [Archaeoglobi archaeon]
MDVIEAGTPVNSEEELESVRKIAREGLNAEVCAFSRMRREDIDAAVASEADAVHLVIPASELHIRKKLRMTPEELLTAAQEITEYARDSGLRVEAGFEDASRAEMEFLLELGKTVAESGAERICYCDTVGVATPEKIREDFESLLYLNTPLSIHCHNDFGLATINSIEALKSGATEVHTTVNGLGERCGNAPFEEVVMVLEELYGVKTGIKVEMLYELSKKVSRITGVSIPPNKAVVGKNAFTHESGIHVDGLLKDPRTYEPYPPERVGRERSIVIGKHAGRRALEAILRENGIELSEEQLQKVYQEFRRTAAKGGQMYLSDLLSLAESLTGKKSERELRLEELTVVCGNRITPTATVRLRINGDEVMVASTGVGPVDAAIKAIERGVRNAKVELEEYHVDAITGGTDAFVDVTVKLRKGERTVLSSAAGKDIVLASVEAFLEGLNRLVSRGGS